MSTERDDPLAPPSAEEEREAARLRQALETPEAAGSAERAAPAAPDATSAGERPGDRDDLAGLVGTARLLARQHSEGMPDPVRERTLRRVLASMPERRPWWRRFVYVGVAAAAAASVAVIAVRWGTSPEGARSPYGQVFRRPFTRDERPVDRLARMIAWRRGRLAGERGR